MKVYARLALAVRGLRLHPRSPARSGVVLLLARGGKFVTGHAKPSLWLLDPPQAIEVLEGRPRLQGPLELMERGERIENGWWDGQPIGRDYFVARNPLGACYWVFREVEGKRRWFIHGICD